ncbi:MAG: YbhB/YbcL family Raf kinase inhibitor-like protein [Myxococcota bacterium]
MLKIILLLSLSSVLFAKEKLKITSSVFVDGGDIPQEYTCDGVNMMPALEWHNAPAKAKSLALIMDDPDATSGTFAHWVVWNIKSSSKSSAELFTARQGRNSGDKKGYIGPCPPSGKHRYFFKIYALDKKINLKDTAGKAALEKAMKGHILEEAQLIGMYEKKKAL